MRSPEAGTARVFWLWAPPVVLMCAIFATSSIPHLDTSATGISDKSLHFWTYGVLAALLVRALAGGRVAGVTRHAAGLAWLIAVGWGAVDEVHQAFVPGRSLSGGDVLANALGAAIGVAASVLAARLWRARRAV